MTTTDWRAEFPILAHKNYLNSCSLGALSRTAEVRIAQFHREWHEYGASAWYGIWMGRLAELRGRVARMYGAQQDEIALAASVSAALTVISSALDYTRRNRVVIGDLDFPTLAYQWLVKRGVDVVFAKSDDGVSIDPARFAELIDERTALVATSHVYYSTGAIQNLRAISDAAHAHGALFLVDGYHGAGQIPVDVVRDDVDIMTGGPLKWLLGGPGLAYMYVRRSLIEQLEPDVTGWFAAREQFRFDTEHFEFHDDARRFELGTPSLPTVHSALGGQEIIDRVGIDTIRAHNAALTERILEGARALGISVRGAAQPEQRSAIVMLADPDPPRTVKLLAERGTIVDYRPGHVRVSPHFYNTEADVDRFLHELSEIRHHD